MDSELEDRKKKWSSWLCGPCAMAGNFRAASRVGRQPVCTCDQETLALLPAGGCC